jgi:glucosamine-6-phosphate deaminase
MSGPAVRTFPSTASMAEAAAADIAATLTDAAGARGQANAMFATGNSQLEMLDALSRYGGVPWNLIQVFHMDEYVGMSDTHPASFARYIRERIAEPCRPDTVHYIDGDNPDGANAEAERYAKLLAGAPLDLCVMGIGENGHLAFNDPPVADFDDPLDVKVVELDDACRRQQVGEGHFATVADVPTHAITATIPALLRARQVVVVCPERRKAPAVARALQGTVSTACPASVLQTQDHVRLYLDADSASLLTT